MNILQHLIFWAFGGNRVNSRWVPWLPVERECFESSRLDQLSFFKFFGRFHQRGSIGSFRIFEQLALIVSNNNFLAVALDYVIRVDRDLATSTWSVDNVLWHRVACRVTSQLFHNLKTFANTCAQVRGTGNEIALVNIIGPHSAHEQFLDMRFHHDRVVVHMTQQHGLISKRNPGVCQASKGFPDFDCQFARMVGMDADEKWMILSKHGTK